MTDKARITIEQIHDGLEELAKDKETFERVVTLLDKYSGRNRDSDDIRVALVCNFDEIRELFRMTSDLYE